MTLCAAPEGAECSAAAGAQRSPAYRALAPEQRLAAKEAECARLPAEIRRLRCQLAAGSGAAPGEGGSSGEAQQRQRAALLSSAEPAAAKATAAVTQLQRCENIHLCVLHFALCLHGVACCPLHVSHQSFCIQTCSDVEA